MTGKSPSHISRRPVQTTEMFPARARWSSHLTRLAAIGAGFVSRRLAIAILAATPRRGNTEESRSVES
jgi:hypothetical protein